MIITDQLIAERIGLEKNSGYWSVNGTHFFFNKAQCLRYATEVKSYKVQYHYFDSVYSSLSWHNEPSESLAELYKRRAEQLREKYDYLVLAYSGGSDSWNVINSFLDNNIPLDEIVTTYPVKAIEKLRPYFNINDTKPANLIFEFCEAAAPKLEEVARNHPNVKITVLDHTEASIDMIEQNKLHHLSLSGVGTGTNLTGQYLIAKKMREYSEKGRAALITGVDKPRMGYSPVSNQFGVWFDDISGVWGNHAEEAFNGFKPTTEHFYYTPNMTDIWQKQCHIMRKTMEPIITETPEVYNNLRTVSPRGNHVFKVHHIFFKKMLYKDWSENIFQAEKPQSLFFQEHSNWFFKTKLTDDKTKDFHYGQVLDFISGVDPKFIKYDEKNKPMMFVELGTRVIAIT
jgi:hypothetical protein